MKVIKVKYILPKVYIDPFIVFNFANQLHFTLIFIWNWTNSYFKLKNKKKKN